MLQKDKTQQSKPNRNAGSQIFPRRIPRKKAHFITSGCLITLLVYYKLREEKAQKKGGAHSSTALYGLFVGPCAPFRSVRLKTTANAGPKPSIHNRITGPCTVPPVLPKAFAHKNGTSTAPAG
ncbi:hypothetical protein [Fournierella sp.]|uniref:hypothetical protein n=1 Tax=Allofournierella sp. TaxID=1940256 RepID=UPI0030790F3F